MTLRLVPLAALTASIALAGLAAGSTPPGPGAGDPDRPARTLSEELKRELLRPAEGELDPRVGDRMTDQPLPPLPEQVILPLPPDHRVARNASQVPLSDVRFGMAKGAIARGLAALVERQQDSGLWMSGATAPTSQSPERRGPVGVAVSAMCVRALAQSSDDLAYDEARRRGLAAIIGRREADGSFGGGPLANYVTSVVVSSLAAEQDPRLRPLVDGGVRWLQGNQWEQGEGVGPEGDWFGGAGYGRSGRPDLSNTQLMLDALYDAGLSPDEPAFQRALAFASRAQNLKRTNGAAWAGDDGGFVYTPANGGESMASEAAGEGRRGELLPDDAPRSLRSYGSMSYAGFKTLLYAGLSVDDVRVRAVFDWVRRHMTFDENPGMGQQGLYYYYLAAARCLRIAQQDEIETPDGETIDWRLALSTAIIERQNEDGTWRNDAERWLEGEEVLCTAYAVLALQEILKPTSFDGAPGN